MKDVIRSIIYVFKINSSQAFVPRDLMLLSYGGSAAPMTILDKAGLDISSPSFWQGGFKALQSKLKQLEEITGGGR